MPSLQIAYRGLGTVQALLVRPSDIRTVRPKQIAAIRQAFCFNSALLQEEGQIEAWSEKPTFQSSRGAKYANNDELLSSGSSS